MSIYKVPSVIGFCNSNETEFHKERAQRPASAPKTYVNRGPVRFRPCLKSDISDQEVLGIKQRHWDHHRKNLINLDLPASVNDAGRDKGTLITNIQAWEGDRGNKLRAIRFLENLQEDNSVNDYGAIIFKESKHRCARELFNLSMVAVSLLPIANFVSGIRKIGAGIKDDGSSYGVVEEDRGLKFKATLIAVGIAEICFLGLIVHGFATFYFAITPPPSTRKWVI